jgi:hypothetical protein
MLMNRLFLLFASVPACFFSQVSIQLSLARNISPASTHELRVRIGKGAATDYSKLELRVPQSATIEAGDVSGGTFSYQDGHAKVIWAITPENDTLDATMKFTAPAAPGAYSIETGYYFMQGENKTELQSESFVFAVAESGSAPADSSFVSLSTRSVAAAEMPATQTNTNVKDPEQRRMLPHQLRKDSRDAQQLGETEKAKAVENLEDMRNIMRQVEYLDDPELKEKVNRKVGVAQKRAERDLQTAEKILALARSLEEEADRLQKEYEATAKAGSGTAAGTSGASKPGTTGKAAEPSGKTGSAPSGTGSSERSGKSGETAKATGSESSELIYRVQVGAFMRKPTAGEFSSVGSVSILSEGNLYKVVTGQYPSRESARSKRDELRQKGYDAFVVGYRGGVRVE